MNQIRFMRYRAISRWIVLSFVVCLALSVVGPVPAAAREPSIITFDAPDAGTGAGQGTFPQVVVDGGAIAGYYIDKGGAFHGFLRHPDGWITEFDVPNSVLTYVMGMNSRQSIVGVYLDSAYVYHAFLRDSQGNFTTINPAGSLESNAGDINDRGEIGGLFFSTSGANNGYVRAPDGTITEFHVPHSDLGPVPEIDMGTPYALNPAGAFVGEYSDVNGVWRGWMRTPEGALTEFDAPHAGTEYKEFQGQYQGTFPDCINPEGAISGWYSDKDNVNHGFVRAPYGEITEFSAPGAGTSAGQGTEPGSISPDGTVSGFYVDANGVSHGFLRSAHGFFTEFSAPGAGTGAGQGTFCYGGIAAGTSTGYYIDDDGAAHGFVWIP